MRTYFPIDPDNSYRPAPPMTRGDGVIEIRYGVAPSPVTGRSDLWAPIVEVNGRRSVRWRSSSRDDAMNEARELAEEERRRYSGDWTISVRRLAD